ncbi:Uncharacterised protein [uncultured archaeon]|nr:Uncharacterised protein [uncultured archaeon]
MRITPQTKPDELRQALSRQRQTNGITLPDATLEEAALNAELAFSERALHFARSIDVPGTPPKQRMQYINVLGQDIPLDILPDPRRIDLLDQVTVHGEIRLEKPSVKVWQIPSGTTYSPVSSDLHRFIELSRLEGSEAVAAGLNVHSSEAIIARNMPSVSSDFATSCFYAAYMADDLLALAHAQPSARLLEFTYEVGDEAGGINKVELALVKGNGRDSAEILPRILHELTPFFKKGLKLRAVDWITPPSPWIKPEGVEDARPPDPNFPRGENTSSITVHRNPKRIHVIRYETRSVQSRTDEYDL